MNRKGFMLLFSSILIPLFAFWSCNREIVPVSEFTPYISAYTGGLVSPTSNIVIELANEQANIEPNTEIKTKLFSFSPSIKGKAYWINARTIEFVPEPDALKSGQDYECKFKLSKVTQTDKRHKTFVFSFRVENRNGEITVESPEISDPAFVSIRGEIRWSEAMDLEIIKKAFSAKTNDNQSFTPIIEATSDPKIFHFIIDQIQRKKTVLALEIRLDGKTAGIGKTIAAHATIPALDVFKVLSAEQIIEPENGVQIVFSDPVSQSQDIRGLVTLSGVKQYTFHIQNNKINLYFDRKDVGEVTLTVNQGLKNTKGERLESAFSTTLRIEKLKPQVELLSDGNILPNVESLVVPFRAVSLYAVDIKIIKIYESNVLFFLQANNLKGSEELRRSGRLVYKKTLRLDGNSSQSIQNWRNYSVDLSQMIRQEPGAIYRIEFSFKKEYSAYSCDNEEDNLSQNLSESLTKLQSETIDEKEEAFWDTPYSYYYNDDYDWEEYDWSERDNPCNSTYYMLSERKVACNVMMSDLGVVAKCNSNNQWWISVSSILTANPLSNVNISFYSYQLQPVGNAKTDGDGFATLTTSGKPFVLVAESGGQKTYLRLVDGEDNSLSRFDTGGKKIEKGLKGFIYGERGVWRPGDTLHISFILYDAEKRIPDNHPVSLEMFNARGQFHSKQILTKGLNGFYTYAVPTNPNDPTGLWNVYIKIGGTSFHKSFRIETIKPNRLKINFKLPGNQLNAASGNVTATLSSAWLTGATAHNLKAKVEMKLTKVNTQFKGYEKYLFNNPATDFTSSESEAFDGALNDNGEATFQLRLPKAEDAPGMLNANILARVFEPGGDASLYVQTVPYSPYSAYVGLNLNQNDNQAIVTDTDHRFDIVTLNSDGKLVNRSNLEYKIYKIDWSWWWQRNNESFASYVNNSSYQAVASGKLQTANGKTSFTFKLKYPGWGKYFIYVKDKDSGHATGGTVFIDWPEYRGRSNKSDPEHVKMLAFSTDKTSYEIGEDITVIIPAATAGNALMALENGSTILDRKRIAVSDKDDTKYTFKATKEMAPNFYIHISLLQPHSQTVNDLPVRMYGVIPVLISNKESILEPQIEMPGVLRPETEFTVEVSEKHGKPMTYTLSIVDDGLLDLTNFKTPNPWAEFYAREALGIRTWDMYDYVMGAFSGKYASMFSIGGDETLKQADEKANRFKPIVKYFGPFSLGSGDTKKYKIRLPMYVGSVRTMVVAGQDGAYGQAEKTTPVRTPLMVLSSLPRVLSANEEISLPVNVFAMETSVKEAVVKIETTGLLQNTSGSQSVKFAQPGDAMVYFSMKTTSKTGIERVKITATGGGQTATETIEIEVRNPNPAVVLSDNKVLNAGESGTFDYQLTGSSNDDWVKLEVSRIPSLNFSSRFDFLYNYEHYCSEQLTSRALPLLFIPQLKEVEKDESDKIKANITEAIKNLYGRQLANGGIVYWPGQSFANEWITTYAGTFLALAEEKGYAVNANVLSKWKAYQRKEAQNWSPGASNSYSAKSSEFQQAYRLYSLALAGSPEWGAMNRLKEKSGIATQAAWCLAAAYAIGGKMKAAEELIFNLQTDVEKYWDSYTYGTSDRDEALILQTLIWMNRMPEAFKQAQKVAKNLSGETYFSTQSTAYSLMAMGILAGKTAGTIECNWTLNGKKQDNIRSAKALYQKQLDKQPASGTIQLTNAGKGVVYVNLTTKSRPIRDTLPEIARNLRLEVSYTDLKGNSINVSELKRGSDFLANVKVANISLTDDYTDLALTHILPSGWEILNESLTSTEPVNTAYTYRDIRDDRVLTYFDLSRNKAKTFSIRLQATYVGSFILPAIQCEAMYDISAQARTTAGRVVVK
ncbi:MAG: alpha-2-macroglobulin [Dysgonamonadaceae bacterium]|jgi:uncharacterized protein YfaS (alpha-2-macroglobulin family)|nr:alpha-2-macroglobulin [Dysgonamonadaceae bacterium]